MSNAFRIPLFPLGVVLFPDSQIPLHIFEQRYKDMVQECLLSDTMFGINFMEDSKVHSVGCTARIIEVLEKHPDGEMDIITEGERRYEVVEVEQPASADDLSYAMVEWLDDVDEARDTELASDTIRLFNELAEIAYSGSVDPIDPLIDITDEVSPSFMIAQKSGLEAPQRQALLTVTSENERLQMLNRFLAQVLPKVKELETIQQLIKNDGYIVTWNKNKGGESTPDQS